MTGRASESSGLPAPRQPCNPPLASIKARLADLNYVLDQVSGVDGAESRLGLLELLEGYPSMSVGYRGNLV